MSKLESTKPTAKKSKPKTEVAKKSKTTSTKPKNSVKKKDTVKKTPKSNITIFEVIPESDIVIDVEQKNNTPFKFKQEVNQEVLMTNKQCLFFTLAQLTITVITMVILFNVLN